MSRRAATKRAVDEMLARALRRARLLEIARENQREKDADDLAAAVASRNRTRVGRRAAIGGRHQ